MIKKVIGFIVATVLVASLIGAIAWSIDNSESIVKAVQAPQSKAVEQFNAFGAAWHTAFDNYRIATFHDRVQNELVTWEGLVSSVDHTGKAFYIIPLNNNNDRGHNFQARIVLTNTLVPSFYQPFVTRVKVTGKVASASVLGVIIVAKKIEPVGRE